MTSGSPKRCVRCGKSATVFCDGCFNAPIYNEPSPQPVYYCNMECREAHRSQHKSLCVRLRARIVLSRAALLLKQIYCIIRMRATPFRWTNLQVHGSVVNAELLNQENARVQWLAPFTINGDEDPAARQALLVLMGGIDTAIYLPTFIKEFLPELWSTIETVKVAQTNPRLKITINSPQGARIIAKSRECHTVFKVKLDNGETWAIDPSSAQFGFLDPLCPWLVYEVTRVGEIHDSYELGTLRWPRIINDTDLYTVSMQKASKCLDKKMRGLSQRFGASLDTILGGSDAEFENAKCRFLQFFEAEVWAAMGGIYSADCNSLSMRQW